MMNEKYSKTQIYSNKQYKIEDIFPGSSASEILMHEFHTHKTFVS